MKILIASLPMDGHFGFLTGLAVYLQRRGHEVAWYTGRSYAEKLGALGVRHLPFTHALEITSDNLTEHYPEYARLGNGPKAIAFALEKVFFVNLEAHLHDILELRADFDFDALVFDAAFYAGRLVAEKSGAGAYPVWPAPTPAPVSKTAPPPFFGLQPMRGPFGRVRDAVVSRLLASSAKGGMRLWNELRAREGLAPWSGNLFDIHNETSTAMFMVGCPGMDFPRDDWPQHLEFVGPLVAHRSSSPSTLSPGLEERIAAHEGHVVVVSQGTVDNRDPDKLFIPALEALAGTRHLVVVTTGGRHTEMLRARFPQANAVIEDWIDYGALMPHAGLFITSGGYGSVMQALVSRVPLLLAGKREGKEDICARMDYRGLGLSLCTERPTAAQIARGVERVLGTPAYRENVERLYGELSSYDPCAIIERRIVAGHGVVAHGGARHGGAGSPDAEGARAS